PRPPICTEPRLGLVPTYPLVRSRRARVVIVGEALAIGAVTHGVTEFAAISQSGSVFAIAGTGLQQAALCLGGIARNDIDHAVHRIRAPQGRAGSADHLDALDVLQRYVLEIPGHTVEKRRIDA